MFKKTTVIVLCFTLLLTFWPFQHASASECIVMQHPETGEAIFYKVLSDNNHPIAYSVFNTQHRCRHFFDRVTVVSGPRPYGEIWIQD